MKKLWLKIQSNLAIYFWEKVFGEDFFDDFPEVEKKIADRLYELL